LHDTTAIADKATTAAIDECIGILVVWWARAHAGGALSRRCRLQHEHRIA
jgi:hypothetical protein